MNLDLKGKILLLKDSNQIDDKTFEDVLKTIDMFKKQGFKVEENAGSMFFIHLAKSLQRIKENKAETLDVSDILQELDKETLKTAEQELKKIEQIIGLDFNKGEKEYVLVYLSSLILENKGGVLWK